MSRNKEKRILTELQRRFLDELSDPRHGGDLRKAMNAAGYGPQTPTSQVYSSLSEEIVEVAQKLVASMAMKSVFALEGIIDQKGGGMGGSNIIKAATTLLDRAGVNKKDESITLDVGQGIVILPAKTSQVIVDEAPVE